MKCKHPGRALTVLVSVGLLCARAQACAQGIPLVITSQPRDGVLAITGVRFEPSGALRLDFPATTGSYYLLLRGESVSNLAHVADAKLPTSETGMLSDSAPPRFAAFYRIQQIPLTDPLDSDSDLIDDVYELQHSEFLNPLIADDALLDSDGDGRSNLEEYENLRNGNIPPEILVVADYAVSTLPAPIIAQVQDSDSADFANGILNITLTGQSDPGDLLAISAPGEIGTCGGNTITYQGISIGTYEFGNSARNLEVRFNSNATQPRVEAVLNSVVLLSTVSPVPLGGRRIMLQLSDGDGGLSDAVFETITVVLPNQPPIVHAGLDRTVPSGIAVFLQGDVEDATLPPPPLLETWWEAIDNPALVHFGDLQSPTTSVTFDQPGTYTLRLNATDQLLSAYDEVVMTAVCTSEQNPK